MTREKMIQSSMRTRLYSLCGRLNTSNCKSVEDCLLSLKETIMPVSNMAFFEECLEHELIYFDGNIWKLQEGVL